MMGDEPAMSLSEFNLIERYFTGRGPRRDDVVLGVGDDCALLRVPGGMELAVSIDTLVAGVHFPEDTPPAAIGHKALAVGLSDLAAMGALPAWATLSISLPRVDEAWLEPFAAGLFALAEAHDVALVGGDTTRGPLCISVAVHGFVPPGQALTRAGARVGDALGHRLRRQREMTAHRGVRRARATEGRGQLGEQIAAAFVLNRMDYLPATYSDAVEAWDRLGEEWQEYVRLIKRDYWHLVE